MNTKTLYQVAHKEFSARADQALKEAEAGRMDELNTLVQEVKTLLTQFTKHGLFLLEEKKNIETAGLYFEELKAQAQAYIKEQGIDESQLI